MNISKMEAGRKILLDPKRGLLKQIVQNSDAKSPVRKKGVRIAGNYGKNLVFLSNYNF